MIPVPLYLVLLLIALPFSALLIYGRYNLRRKAREMERNGGVEPAFSPVDVPQAGWLLRHFSPAERVYLQQNRSGRRTLALILAYMFTVFLCAGLLPSAMQRYGLPGGGPISVWRSYLTVTAIGNAAYSIFGLMFGFVAVFDISRNSNAAFSLTRPLSRRILYWQRVLPNVAELLAGFGLAVAISMLILVVTHGPVFNHLYDADAVRAVVDGEMLHKIVLTLRTSATRIFLSIALVLLLNFSLVVVLSLQPFLKGRAKTLISLPVVWVAILGSTFLTIFRSAAPGLARYLFVYARPGTPPPYRFALIPLGLSVAMLLLGSFFHERLER